MASSATDFKASYPPNIYIIGAQSTGKTTLVTALDEHFRSLPSYRGQPIERPAVLTEIARGILKQHLFTAADITTSTIKAIELQILILHGQNEAEEAIQPRWFVADRSSIDTAIYAEKYGDANALSLLMGDPAWSLTLNRMRHGLIVLCEAGVPWLIDDGTRLMPRSNDDWFHLHDLFLRRLHSLGLDFVLLPRDIVDREARLHFVLHAWECFGVPLLPNNPLPSQLHGSECPRDLVEV